MFDIKVKIVPDSDLPDPFVLIFGDEEKAEDFRERIFNCIPDECFDSLSQMMQAVCDFAKTPEELFCAGFVIGSFCQEEINDMKQPSK